MRIRQAQCNVGTHFAKSIRKKYGLRKYSENKEPCFWMGCYGEKQLETILNHKSVAVLMWAGSDISWVLKKPEFIERLKKVEHIRHIAISSFIADDLKKIGLPYTNLPILPHDNSDFKPTPLGDSIYIYKSEYLTYGRPLNQKVKELMPHMSFIECNFHSYNRDECKTCSADHQTDI